MSPTTHEGAVGSPSDSHQLATWTVLGGAVVVVLGLASLRFHQNPDSPRQGALRPLPEDAPAVLADEPEMDDEYWPCSDCHEGEEVSTTPRELEDEHDMMEFEHGTLWCFDCHEMIDRDQLKLANGSLVDFDETWKLCTQCHGDKLDDWRAGIHGKRLGHWRGEKEYLPCVQCHNPHGPNFEPMAPKPPPVRPEQIQLAGGAAAAPATEGEQAAEGATAPGAEEALK